MITKLRNTNVSQKLILIGALFGVVTLIGTVIAIFGGPLDTLLFGGATVIAYLTAALCSRGQQGVV